MNGLCNSEHVSSLLRELEVSTKSRKFNYFNKQCVIVKNIYSTRILGDGPNFITGFLRNSYLLSNMNRTISFQLSNKNHLWTYSSRIFYSSWCNRILVFLSLTKSKIINIIIIIIINIGEIILTIQKSLITNLSNGALIRFLNHNRVWLVYEFVGCFRPSCRLSVFQDKLKGICC